MMTELSQLNSFLSLVIAELNRREVLAQEGRKWDIQILMRQAEIRGIITLLVNTGMKQVYDLRVGVLSGNQVMPYYKDLLEVFADGMIMKAEKLQIL